MATPYTVTLIVALGSPKGPTKAYSFTASDVNAANWLNAAGQANTTFNGNYDCYVVDAILSAAGVTTSQAEFFVGGVSTGFKLQDATSTAATIIRPLTQAPIRVPAGLSLLVQQET